MERNELVVSKDGHSEVCTVEETVETSSTVYARVEGEHLGGWVEVPDNPATPKHVLICEDCGREPHPDPDKVGPLRKENSLNHRGSAEVLKSIHETLRPSHSPRIEKRAA